ncbi:MAG TPA: UdgX family uracil-DNA binding protein [Rhizomicrobium sp.]|nr:UdgX family uracil-DNA binding protein [Rhizomicrobium sp.]
MIESRIAGPTDWDGWRSAARNLLAHSVAPDRAVWSVAGGMRDLLADEDAPLPVEQSSVPFSVPRGFFALAESAILHRDPARFALLYELLWRLQNEKSLLSVSVDPLVAKLEGMAKAVHRDQHKMKAFVRFREIAADDGAHFVAWFEPEHFIVEATAPFFARRFTNLDWTILTPDRCAHWNKVALFFAEGASKHDAPAHDAIEEIWRTYYRSIFNPARLKVNMMRKEMPKKYWRNLPEAPLIKPLTDAALPAAHGMIAAGGSAAKANPQRMVEMKKQADDLFTQAPGSLAELRREAAHCRACPLWKDATQTVFGEGAAHAPLMLVGEQPGDKEDLAGKPFVGPAGAMLDRALEDVGIERKKTYVTNAVKHFKFTPRGKIRLHQKPNTAEIKACNPWLQRERAAVKPRLIVALGATAAHGVFGKAMAIGKNRGKVIELEDGAKALITVHPSYLLRVEEKDKAREYAAFVHDLKVAVKYLAR